jgi:hypothetical protein
MHGHAKWGTKKGSTLIHASSALTPISTCTPLTAIQNICLFFFKSQTEKLTETLKVMLQAGNLSCVLMNLAEMCKSKYNWMTRKFISLIQTSCLINREFI